MTDQSRSSKEPLSADNVSESTRRMMRDRRIDRIGRERHMNLGRILSKMGISLLLLSPAHSALSSDACSERAIVSSADVTVSDGSSFETRSYYHSKDYTAIHHIDDHDQVVAVEGPLSWARKDDASESGGDFYKIFALSHQYHALLLDFEEIVSDLNQNLNIEFRGGKRRGATGTYPYGGRVHLIDGDEETRPAGFLFEFPDIPVITTTLHDWRTVDGVMLPYRVQIDDGDRIFDYRYTDVQIESRTPLWYFDAIEAPPIDEVQIVRLHRKLLAAHCLGDAELMAALSAPEVVSANRGELSQTSNDSIRERFAQVFQRLDYTEYHDVTAPVIEVSKASDVGWIAVSTRAIGSVRETNTAFDQQWAWVMMVGKFGDNWLHTGNASNTPR